MKKIYPVKKKLSFKENIQNVLPEMYDDFMSYSGKAVNHPRLKNVLHQMRITGKPLRYAMEYSEAAFGTEFKKYLTEIKYIIELIGEIHDADVIIPELDLHLKEIRHYNRTLTNRIERLSTGGITKLIKEQKEKRTEMFEEFCSIINHWINEDFRTRLISSMSRNPSNLSIVKPKAG